MAFEFSIISSSLISFIAVFFAEFGDKSQLICMALAANYAARIVLPGAIGALAILNLLAVVIGTTVAASIPDTLVATVAITLFTYFGVRALLYKDNEKGDSVSIPSENIFIGVFILIFLAEFGDKTQFAIMSLSATKNPVGVWIGATFAVVATSAIGVFMGSYLLSKLKKKTLHRVGGLIFLGLAALTLYRYFY